MHTAVLLLLYPKQDRHSDASLQACFSACAKMCVRELRKTDTANVSVFYLSFCSTIGATIGLCVSYIWGGGQGLLMPHSFEWLLFLGIGESHLFCPSPATPPPFQTPIFLSPVSRALTAVFACVSMCMLMPRTNA